jgi:hypothetical protein
LAICDDVSTQATLIDGSEVLTGATRPVQDPATAEAIAHAPEATAAVSEP